MTGQRFPRVRRLARGYAVRQVDGYLERVERALAGGRIETGTSAAAIRRAAFDLVRGGYDPAAVDAALDELEERALAVEAEIGAGPAGRQLASEVGALRARADARRGARFPRTGWLRRGYQPEGVDALLDAIAAALDGTGGGLDADAVRRSVFRPRRGGYDEDSVDNYLDRVVDVLLRRALPSAGG